MSGANREQSKDPLKQILIEASRFYDNGMTFIQQNELYGAIVNLSLCANSLYIIKQFKPGANVTNFEGDWCGDPQGDSCDLETLLSRVLGYVAEAKKKFNQQRSSMGGGGGSDDTDSLAQCCGIASTLVNFKPNSAECKENWFSFIIGLEEQKNQMYASFIYPLMMPNLFSTLSKGLLLFGPPGTGKTLLAKAAVNQLRARDPTISILFFAPKGGDLKGKYVGETEAKIESLFKCAKQFACKDEQKREPYERTLSIIFLDEVESVAGDRSNDPSGTMKNSVNALLQAMDGVNSFKNVTVIAATNYPWDLDSAFLRRFDNIIHVPLPTASDIETLIHLKITKYVTHETIQIQHLCGPSSEQKDQEGKSCEERGAVSLPCEQADAPNYSLWQESKYRQYIRNLTAEKVSLIATKCNKEGYSNSDVDRIWKLVVKQLGEEAVSNNIFFEIEPDIYLSTLVLGVGGDIPLKSKKIKIKENEFYSIVLFDKTTEMKVFTHQSEVPKNFGITDPVIDNIYLWESTKGEYMIAAEMMFPIEHKTVKNISIFINGDLGQIRQYAPTSIWRFFYRHKFTNEQLDVMGKRNIMEKGLLFHLLSTSNCIIYYPKDIDSFVKALEPHRSNSSPRSTMRIQNLSFTGFRLQQPEVAVDVVSLIENLLHLKNGLTGNTFPIEKLVNTRAVDAMRGQGPVEYKYNEIQVALNTNPNYVPNRTEDPQEMAIKMQKLRNWNITDDHWDMAKKVIHPTADQENVKLLSEYDKNPQKVLDTIKKKRESKG